MQNDFLSSLSSRALQDPDPEAPARGLQPRLPSRFENLEAPVASTASQTPDPDGFVEVESEGNAGSRRATSVQQQSPTPVVQRDQISKNRSGPGLLTGPEPSFEKGGHSLPGDQKRTSPDLQRPMLAEDQVDMSPILPVSVERSAFPSSLPRNENHQPSAISPVSGIASRRGVSEKTSETHTQAAELAPPSSDLKSLAPLPAMHEALPGVQPKIVPERIEITRVERQVQLPANGSQIVPSLNLSGLKTQNTTPETQEQPPTIHVTIGRIEVKATTPTAAPKRRASASPTMGLDEYLRRRSGGER